MYAEGKARIEQGSAFLNPKARFLRDTSVAFVASIATRGSKILDATAGTGIRGIRYYLETKSKSLTMLDMNRDAYRSAALNIKANKVKAEMLNLSVQEFTNTTAERFNFIDVDPFGGISPYIYDIMKVSKDGTCLMLTCTDAAVLCGAHPNACIRLYGSKPMHNELCHETGIRTMINYVVSVAAQFNFGIDVLFSLYYAHYMRIFLRLLHGNASAMASIGSTGYAHYCANCGFYETEKRLLPRQRTCRSCKLRMPAYGRMWLGSLYERKMLDDIVSRTGKMGIAGKEARILEAIQGEPDIPLFYSVPKMTKRLHLPSVRPSDLMDALEKKGYAAARTQFDDSGIKSDASLNVINSCIRKLSR